MSASSSHLFSLEELLALAVVQRADELVLGGVLVDLPVDDAVGVAVALGVLPQLRGRVVAAAAYVADPRVLAGLVGAVRVRVQRVLTGELLAADVADGPGVEEPDVGVDRLLLMEKAKKYTTDRL